MNIESSQLSASAGMLGRASEDDVYIPHPAPKDQIVDDENMGLWSLLKVCSCLRTERVRLTLVADVDHSCSDLSHSLPHHLICCRAYLEAIQRKI